MPDFTTLFAETLNATISKMVAEAVAAQTTELEELRERVKMLEEVDLDRVIESKIENYDFSDIVKSDGEFDSAVENYIDNYDFTEIVKEAIDTDSLFEGRDFESAVKSVISDALQR